MVLGVGVAAVNIICSYGLHIRVCVWGAVGGGEGGEEEEREAGGAREVREQACSTGQVLLRVGGHGRPQRDDI